MANSIMLFIDTHRRRIIETFIYAICITSVVILIILGAPGLYAMVIVSWGSTLVGLGMFLLLGISLGYLLNHIILLIENYWKSHSDISSLLKQPPINKLEISPVSTIALEARALIDEEKIPRKVNLSKIGVENTQRFHLDPYGPAIRTFENRPFVLITGEHTDLLYLEKDESKKILEVSLIAFPEQKAKKRKRDLSVPEEEILLPLEKAWDVKAWSSFEPKANQEEKYFIEQFSSPAKISRNLGIELSEGHLIPKNCHNDCDLILPLPDGYYITVLNTKGKFHSTTLTQWQLEQNNVPVLIHEEKAKGNIVSLIYLENDWLASIEGSKKTAKIQVWKWGNYKHRTTLVTLDSSEYNQNNPLKLLALAKSHFLSFGGRHGIKRWEPVPKKNSSQGSRLEFKASLLKRPNFWKPFLFNSDTRNDEYHNMHLVLLKYNYMVSTYLSDSLGIYIFDLDSPDIPLTPVKIIPSNGVPCSVEAWKEFLFISYQGNNSFFIYNIKELMKEKSETQRGKLLKLLDFFTVDLSKIILNYCEDDFDRAPKDCVQLKR